MRPDYVGIAFMFSGVVSFNAGIWQIFRRSQKKQLMANHENMDRPPFHELPPEDAKANDCDFHAVALDGCLDNEGSYLVGPRPIPSYKGAANTDESSGGFLIMTPFEVANTNQFVMVNRGWVPIDAGKHRTMLTQYIGEGFSPMQVRGILRKEEYIGGGWFSESPDNLGPVAADLSWLAIRPWNMIRDYYSRRWGASSLEGNCKEHGAHHYYVEMLEDFSGDDQRMVRGHAWPRRRDADEVSYVHLTPIVHTMYIFFWFSVAAGSMYGMGKCWRRQQEIFQLRKRVNVMATKLEQTRQKEAAAYFDAMQEVERIKRVGSSGTAAAAAQLNAAASSAAKTKEDGTASSGEVGSAKK